jgi:hypothetical protein
MTEKQIENIKIKIAKYKKALSLDKKHWGGNYHDGKGIRYLIPALYIKISDYKGGLKYFNWFNKNFPDDSCYPILLFEWTFILFKCNKLSDAEKKLHLTFFSNTYLLDKFLGKEFLEFDKNESSSWDIKSLAEYFHYYKNEPEFIEFANWITEKLQTRFFLDKANRFIEIGQLLKNEPLGEKRNQFLNELYKMKYEKI